ncbi:MAG: hypothetical protein ACKO96_10470, partial [Flammeovirgaceae bacterium]
EEVIAKINGDVTEKLKGYVTNDEVTALKSDLEAVKGLETKSAEYEKSIAKLEGKLEALTEKAHNDAKGNVKATTLGDLVVKGIENEVEAIKSGKTFTLDTKADTTITGDYT